MTDLATALDQVPDEPGLVDLRGLLLSGRADLFHAGDLANGFVAVSWDFPFGATWGRPSARTITTAAAGRTATGTAWAGEGFADEWNLLVPEADAGRLAPMLPDWVPRGITLHDSPTAAGRPDAAPPEGVDVRLFADGHRGALDTSHLSPEFRHELELDWVAAQPLAAAFDDGQLLSVCFAPLETETRWDVAVETVPEARRRGLAAACFHLLRRHQATRGKTPVWGALDDNVASMRLASRLGFTPTARLVSFVPPSTSTE